MRITPITAKHDVALEHHDCADAVLNAYGQIRGPWTVLLHSPTLAERIVPLAPFFWNESVIESRVRSVAILAAVREQGAAYVWAAQVTTARRNGLREEVIELLRNKGDPGRLPAEERDIVIYVRQLLRGSRVEQPLFDAMMARHGAQWLVELTACVGYFGLVSGVSNAFEVPAPADGDKLP